MPFSRRSRFAASRSPFVSSSARLQSIIPAPVWSRSSLTSFAEISAIGALALRGGGRLCLGLRLWLRRLGDRLLTLRDLLVVTLGNRLDVRFGLRRGVAVAVRAREVARCHLRLPCCDAVCDRADDQAARPDGVVVPRDDVVRLVGVAVRVDERDDRKAEPPSLAHSELLLPEVDDADGVR